MLGFDLRQIKMLQNSKMYALTVVSVILIGFLALSLALSPLTKTIIINNSGKILARTQFDNCDQVDNWKATNPDNNLIELETENKIEGSACLKGTFAAKGKTWGGMFYKTGLWNLSNTPLMRIWIKLEKPISELKIEVIAGSDWYGFWYYIYDQLIIGKWTEVVIDLRTPDYYTTDKCLPDLTMIRQIALFTWEEITEPLTIYWDNITVSGGPYISPRVEIKPKNSMAIINEKVTFIADVLGGEPPYMFKWYVNYTLQKETSSTFTFEFKELGYYEILCEVMDNKGNISTSTANVSVISPPPSQPSIPVSLEVFKSEVRAVSVAYVWSSDYNHTKIAETLFNYGINTAYVDISKAYLLGGYVWPTEIKDLPYHRLFVEECHKRGIRVIASLVTMYRAPPQLRTLTPSGEIDWLDVSKNQSKAMLKAIIEALATRYGFDGINLDYIRWDSTYCPLGEEARLKFINDTGLTDVNWPDDVLEGGRYYYKFVEWRVSLITDVVKSAYNWAKAVNPNIVIVATPIRILPGASWYWIKHNGQDVAEWIANGYVEYVSPMLYETSPGDCVMWLESSKALWTGGSEGAVPIIPWIDYMRTNVTVFVQRIQAIKEAGVDGWILNPYCGPGAEKLKDTFGWVDIRPYLCALHEAGLMEPIWAIQNFTVAIDAERKQATISWTTTTPTIGVIEYANHSIYETKILYYYEVPYKDIDYIGGTTIADEELKTEHTFIIPINDQTQFRIQSVDEKGVKVTSKVFSASSIP